MPESCESGDLGENYRDIAIINSRWPLSGNIAWRDIRNALYDPKELISQVDNIKGIGRKKEYFESEKREYLRIFYNRDRYINHLEKSCKDLGSAESERDLYNCLDAMRNYSLHFLDSWNKHSYLGELSSIEKVEDYEELKTKTYGICEELYQLITMPEYEPDICKLEYCIDTIRNCSKNLPETCESKIRQLDNPVELIIHCKRVNMLHPHFDTVIGVLDGGIELPMVMKYLQKVKPNITYLKYSGYSEGGHSKKAEKVDEKVSVMELLGIDRKLRDADVCILDDSIFTGRTFYRVVDALVGKGKTKFSSQLKPRKLTVSAVETISHKDIGAQISQIGDFFEVLDRNDVDIIPPTFIRDVRKSDIKHYLDS